VQLIDFGIGQHGNQTDMRTELLQKICQQEPQSRQIGEETLKKA